MKHTKYITVLILTAILSVVLGIFSEKLPDIFPAVIAFPFGYIAKGLGALSGLGNVGNGLAIALWFSISAIPALIALKYPNLKDRKTLPERITLFVLTAAMLFTFYVYNNISLFSNADALDGFMHSFKDFVAFFPLWSLVLLYFTFLLVRLFRSNNKTLLWNCLKYMIYILGVIFVIGAGLNLTEMIKVFMAEEVIADTVVSSLLLTLPEIAAYVFNTLIALSAIDLINIINTETQEGLSKCSAKLCKFSGRALILIAIMTALSNLLQLILMRFLSNISMTINLPIENIAFVLAVFVFSGILVENKQLRDDNNMFI